MRQSALVSLALCASIGSATAQDVLRTHDLSLLLSVPPGHAQRYDTPKECRLLLPAGPLIPFGHDGRDVVTRSVSHRSLSAAVPFLTESALRPWFDSITEGAGESPILNGRLYLRAPRPAHDAIQAEIALLEGLVRSSVRVRFHVLPSSAPAEVGGVLRPEQVRRLLAAHPPVRTHAQRVIVDVPTFVESGRAQRYLRDLDTQLAQETAILDPKLDAYFVGDRVGFGLSPLADGRWLVRAGFEESTQLGLVRRPLGTKLGGELQLPELGFARTSLAVAMPRGGGVIAGAAGDDRGPWLIELEDVAPPTQDRALPLAHLLLQPMTGESLPDVVVRPGNDRGWFGRPDPDGPHQLSRVISAFLPEEASDDVAEVRRLGTWALFAPGQTVPQGVRQAVAADAASLRNWRVEWRLGIVPKAGVDVTPAALARSLTAGGVATTLEGRTFSSATGTERAIVRDFEVSVAQKANGKNPIVDGVYSAWFLRGQVTTQAGGNPALRCEFLWADTPRSDPLSLTGDGPAVVDTPSTAVTSAHSEQVVEVGQWQMLLRQPHPSGKEGELVLVARVLGQ